MIKKLLLTSTIATIGFSNSSAIINEAMQYYKNKNYTKALQEFEKIATYKSSSGVDFYIGRSYYELGQYEKALSAYDRFLINNPQHKRAQLEVAQTYYKLKMYDEALGIFNTLLNDPSLPEVVKQNIQLRVASIKSKITKHNLKTSIIMGFGYDDNINNNTDAASYNVNIGDFTVPISSDRKDSFFYDTGLLFNHIYSHSELFALKNNVTLYHQNYERDTSKELTLISLNTAPVLRVFDSNIMLKFGYDHIWYSGDNYLDTFYFTPSISKAFGTNKMYHAALKIAKKDFTDAYENKDSLYYELKNRYMFQTKNYGIFTLDLTLSKEERDKGVDPNISHNKFLLSIFNSYDLTKDITLTSSMNYSEANYKHQDPSFSDTKREDEKYNLGLNMSYKYSKNTTVGLSYNYIDQSSNHKAYDYDKQIVKSYLQYSF